MFCKLKLIPRAQCVLSFRASHTGAKRLATVQTKTGSQDIHLTSASSYPQAQSIPLPNNVEDINAIETVRFSPQRSRDITADVILAQSVPVKETANQDLSADRFLESYDCHGTVSLNSAMQTNVPDPYVAKGKAPTHLNMPGGEWGRSDKYMAQDLQNSHYTNIKDRCDGNTGNPGIQGKQGTYSYLQNLQTLGNQSSLRYYSTAASGSDSTETKGSKNDKVEKLKKAVKDYGATVIVFHIGISLISLGGFYLAVTSGIDVSYLTFGKADLPREVPGEVGAFVIAYAVHKLFAPVRISLTLLCTPVIVRHLRKIGFLSTPKPPT